MITEEHTPGPWNVPAVWVEHMAHGAAQFASVTLAVNELLAVVKDIEWSPDSSAGEHCPWCQNARITGHSSACRLAAALKLARGEAL